MGKTSKTHLPKETVEAIASIAGKAGAKAAAEFIAQERKREKESRYDRRLGNTKLLLENTENTFVTPVFNGSTSLRLAAGQLIEDTAKAVRRKQDTSPAALEEIYSKTSALYRLDAITVTPGTGTLGPLPGEAKCLLWGLGLCWLGIGFSCIRDKRKGNH